MRDPYDAEVRSMLGKGSMTELVDYAARTENGRDYQGFRLEADKALRQEGPAIDDIFDNPADLED